MNLETLKTEAAEAAAKLAAAEKALRDEADRLAREEREARQRVIDEEWSLKRKAEIELAHKRRDQLISDVVALLNKDYSQWLEMKNISIEHVDGNKLCIEINGKMQESLVSVYDGTAKNSIELGSRVTYKDKQRLPFGKNGYNLKLAAEFFIQVLRQRCDRIEAETARCGSGVFLDRLSKDGLPVKFASSTKSNYSTRGYNQYTAPAGHVYMDLGTVSHENAEKLLRFMKDNDIV